MLYASIQYALFSPISVSPVVTGEYVSQRARGAYIASLCRLQCSLLFSRAAQNSHPTTSDGLGLNRAMRRCKEEFQQGLSFVALNRESVFMVVFVDASFASNCDLTSQLGFIVCQMDKSNSANIIHYASTKSKRVIRGVLAAELYAFVYGFDQSFVLCAALKHIVGLEIVLKVNTDSKCLFNVLISLNTTTEKHLLIDESMLRHWDENREISEVFGFWVIRTQPTDLLNPIHATLYEKLWKPANLTYHQKYGLEDRLSTSRVRKSRNNNKFFQNC